MPPGPLPPAKGFMPLRRRTFSGLLLATIGSTLAVPLFALPKAHVVVIGGGVAGATIARRLANAGAGIDVTLIEPNRRYTTPFFSNRSLAGLQSIEMFTHGYDRLSSKDGIAVVHDRVVDGDPTGKTVRLAGGQTLAYDRLVVCPGTSLLTSDIEGYTSDSPQVFPHAYDGSSPDQWLLLRRQIQDMDDGGVVIISAPARPYKCTPAPYERASLIAGYLKSSKPKSKLLILDTKVEFPMMDVLIADWENRFGNLVEWISADFGGTVSAVDNTARSIRADGETYTPAVANIIPAQRAGAIAATLDLVDDSGWCPVNPQTFASTRHADIHVLGDAIDAGDMPKSASAAHQQALSAAVAIVNLVSGSTVPLPELENACYFLTQAGRGLVVGGRYRVSNGRIAGVEGYSSAPGERTEIRQKTAERAEKWYGDVTHDMFG